MERPSQSFEMHQNSSKFKTFQVLKIWKVSELLQQQHALGHDKFVAGFHLENIDT